MARGKTFPRWVEFKYLVVALYSPVNLPPIDSHHEIWVMSKRVTLGGQALPEGQSEKLGDPGGAWSREEPVEVAWASG